MSRALWCEIKVIFLINLDLKPIYIYFWAKFGDVKCRFWGLFGPNPTDQSKTNFQLRFLGLIWTKSDGPNEDQFSTSLFGLKDGHDGSTSFRPENDVQMTSGAGWGDTGRAHLKRVSLSNCVLCNS